jgi:hypothetical protein
LEAWAATAQDAVFSDGFESGDLSAWSTASTGSGDLSVQPGAALAGTGFGLHAIVDDTVGLYVQDDTPADETRYRARFYFDPSGFDPGEAENHRRTRLFLAFEEAPTRRLLAIVLRRINGEYAVMARVRRNDNSQANTPFFPISPGEHWVEFDWARASTPTATDGTFQLWLDGTLVSTLTGLADGAGAIDFVRLGALSVKPGATGVLMWDQFASRPLTAIGPSLGPGADCVAADQCGTASCVDGVCCHGGCPGVCQACDVGGAAGTCSPIPSGQDPDAECGGVSCAGYYAGWFGNSCRRKPDVSAAQASCSGGGSCRTPAQECGAQPGSGATQITCDSLCQTPNSATCTGTTAGVCINISAGNETCGSGVCQVTQPRCSNGAPHTCTPNTAAAGPEACNNLDDNCDGIVDNNALFADGYEPNGDCNSYRTLPTVGSDQTLTQNAITIYPSGDVDYFRINAAETDNSCACCDFWCTDEDYTLTVTLTVPAGAGSYEFCTNNTCGAVSTYCQVVAQGASFTWTWDLDGGCPGNDTYAIYFRIRPANAPGFECLPYTLRYGFDSGVCRNAAPEQGIPGPAGAPE